MSTINNLQTDKTLPKPELSLLMDDFNTGVVSPPKDTFFDQVVQAATGVANTVNTVVNTVQTFIPPKGTTVINDTPTYQTPPIVASNNPILTQNSQLPANNIPPAPAPKKDNTMLYVGGGIGILLLGAYFMKKKKYVKAKV